MTDKLDFLEGGSENTPAPTPEANPAPVAPAAAPEPSPAPPDTSPPALEADTQSAKPKGAAGWTAAMALDEREKRQRLQRDFEDLQRKYEDATKQPQKDIDIFSDPEGFRQQIAQEVAAAKWDAITTWSLESATEKYGAATLKEAQDAVQSEMQRNPGFFQQIQRERHPYDFVVKWHKRQQAVMKLGDDDPDTWFEKQAKAKGYILASEQQAAPAVSPSPQSTPLPRASLASAPAASGNVSKTPVGPGTAFDEAFKR